MAEQSRTEEILRATIDGDEYTKTPQSREEELLIKLKQTIEAGGGASVVPNPEGEATETLTKLGINDTVYGIPKELPAVTSADAGNVLGVNSEGLWDKVAPSGAEVYIVELNSNYTYKNGVRNSDIISKINSGAEVIIKGYYGTIYRYFGLYSYYQFFSFFWNNDRTIFSTTYILISNNLNNRPDYIADKAIVS